MNSMKDTYFTLTNQITVFITKLLYNCSIDATEDDQRYGRMVNHSKKFPNAVPKVFAINGIPRLCLMALRDIEIGEELLYDYGERRKDVLDSNPWLIL